MRFKTPGEISSPMNALRPITSHYQYLPGRIWYPKYLISNIEHGILLFQNFPSINAKWSQSTLLEYWTKKERRSRAEGSVQVWQPRLDEAFYSATLLKKNNLISVSRKPFLDADLPNSRPGKEGLNGPTILVFCSRSRILRAFVTSFLTTRSFFGPHNVSLLKDRTPPLTGHSLVIATGTLLHTTLLQSSDRYSNSSLLIHIFNHYLTLYSSCLLPNPLPLWWLP